MDKQIQLGKFLIIVFICTLFLYIKTMMPGVDFWDTGEFQTIPYSFDIGHPTGYPTYILIGKIYLSLFKFNEVAWRMNLFSALCTSLSLTFISLVVYKITKNMWLAVVSVLLMSVNPTIWSISTKADPHTLHLLFTSLIIFLIYKFLENRKKIYINLTFLLVGFSLGNHMLSIFFIVPLLLIYLIYLYSLRKQKTNIIIFNSLILVVLFLIGTSVYILLPIISIYKQPLTTDYRILNIENFKRMVFGQDFSPQNHNWINGNLNEAIAFYFNIIKNSFPFYAYLLSISGLLVGLRKNFYFNLILLILFIETTYFSLGYQNAAIDRYFITSILIVFIWIAIYLGHISSKFKKNILVNTAILFYLALLIAFNLKLNFEKMNLSNNTYADYWARTTITSLPNDSYLYSWWSYSTPLWYIQKIEKLRTDITIVNAGSNEWFDMAKNVINHNRVFFIEEIQIYDNRFEIVKYNNIFELVLKNIN